MKRILITGMNSYIGVAFENYLKQWPEKYQVDTVDMIDCSWRKMSFSVYDTVFHVAGIAHANTARASDSCKALYYKINTDLTIETAQKAKADGVKQFIFMSSSIIYGDCAPIGNQKIIANDTVPHPTNIYGDSKLQAENGILPMQDGSFNVVVLRPPMIYGKDSKGNYQILSKYAQKLPIFPYVNNQRSILYIGNLVEFVRLIIENYEQGIFWPQNGEYSNTSLLMKEIRAAHGKRMHIINGFTWALKIMSHLTRLVVKGFGSFTYDMSISEYKMDDYRIYNLQQSIVLAEKKGSNNE